MHERALGLLAVRARSRRELERRLRTAGFESQEVEDELSRLERVGLIDDEAFARQVAQHAFGGGGKGRRAVVSSLAASGVPAEITAAVLDEIPEDEGERASDIAAARVARMDTTDPRRSFQRLSALLLRRGFTPDVARSAARKALAMELDEGG